MRGGSTKHGGDDDENNVTNNQLENFEHANLISTDQSPKFDRQMNNFLSFKKKFMSVAKTHNI